jgi:hypothetical protein
VSKPLYPRVLRLRHVHPNGWQRALLFEGSVGAGALLALTDRVSAWTPVLIPLVVAVLVKAHDVLVGLLGTDRDRLDDGLSVLRQLDVATRQELDTLVDHALPVAGERLARDRALDPLRYWLAADGTVHEGTPGRDPRATARVENVTVSWPPARAGSAVVVHLTHLEAADLDLVVPYGAAPSGRLKFGEPYVGGEDLQTTRQERAGSVRVLR